MIFTAQRVSIEELIEVLGLVDALQFVERFSGARVYVPHQDRISQRGIVAAALGVCVARQLALRWAEKEIEVPSGTDYLYRRRSLEIHREKDLRTVRELAAKYRLSEHDVNQILATSALALLTGHGKAAGQIKGGGIAELELRD